MCVCVCVFNVLKYRKVLLRLMNPETLFISDFNSFSLCLTICLSAIDVTLRNVLQLLLLPITLYHSAA